MFQISVVDIQRNIREISADPPQEQLSFLKKVRRERSVDMDQPARRMLKHHINEIRHRLGCQW